MPILNNTNKSLGKMRLDASGNQILKGKKTHQVSFKDNPELVKTTVIENWKSYNIDINNKGCRCVIQ